MKMGKKFRIALCVCTAIVLSIMIVPIKSSWADYDYSDWMGKLSSTTKISHMTIPGTHQSPTFNIEDGTFAWTAKCQDLNFEKQLQYGVRAFDVRYVYENNAFYIYHGSTDAPLVTTSFMCYDSDDYALTLNNILYKFYSFLKSHPKEVIFVSISCERGDTATDKLNQLYSTYNIATNLNDNTTLGSMRGRIVDISNLDNTNQTTKWNTAVDTRISDIKNALSIAPKVWKNYSGTIEQKKITTNVSYFAGSDVTSSPEDYANKVHDEVFSTNPFSANGQRAYGIVNYDFVDAYLGYITLSANDWAKAGTVTVTFDYQNGSSSTTKTITEGEPVTAPTAPSRMGYTFGGWYTDTTYKTAWNFSDGVPSNMTLYAKWDRCVYNINYYNVEDADNSSSPTQYTYGLGVTLKAPSRVGYTFGGWYTNSQFSGSPVTSISTTQVGDVNLYAKWTANTYNVTYKNIDGADNSSNRTTFTYDSGDMVLANPTKRGYTFKGWYTDEGLTNNISSFSTKRASDITLYASWQVNTYKINYELYGGTNDTSNPYSYTYGKGVASLKDPTKTGYTFKGWYNDSSFKTPFSGIATTDIDDKTVYAKWEANVYNITYHMDGGDNAESNTDTFTYDVGLKLADPTKTGYTFKGWFTDSTFSIQINEISPKRLSDIDVYAKWEANVYTITYHMDGGTNPEENVDRFTYDVGLKLSDPTKTGYTFKGWFREATYTNQVTEVSPKQLGNIDIYAKWEANVYSITYYLNGGDNSSLNPDKFTYDIGVDKLYDPTKTGYTFKGWFTDSLFRNQVYQVSAKQLGNIELYAKWEANVYAINYHMNEGDNSELNPDTFTYDEGFSDFYEPTKRGYTFKGWFAEETFDTQVYGVSAKQLGDFDVYAKWEANVYKITYEVAGGDKGDNPDTYTYDVGVPELKDPTRRGYVFGGWFSDSALQDQVTSVSPKQLNGITLYAYWQTAIYNIKYELDGGTNRNNPESYLFGKGVGSFNAPSKIGNDFMGWYRDSDYTIPTTSIGTNEVGEITLYAKWEPIKYKITYSLGDNGVNSENNPDIYTYGVGVESLDAPTRNGYDFVGWYKDSSYKTQIDSISTTTYGAITIYAKWTAATYNIYYEVGEGAVNNSKNPTSYTFGKAIRVLYEPTRDGFTFDGWYTDETYTTKFSSSIITAKTYGDFTFWAKWTVKAKQYKITYELNGGTQASGNPAYYTEGVGATIKDATRTNYDFLGWYMDGVKVSKISATQTGEVTLVAKWSPKVYSIEYILGDGAEAPAAGNPTTYTFGVGTGTLNAPTKPYSEFLGWHLNSSSGTEVTSISTTQSGNVKLYAMWTEVSYNITYYLNGGVEPAVKNPTTYIWGKGVEGFNAPTKQYYTFGGWKLESGEIVESIPAEWSGDINLFAIWIADVYNITYDTAGGKIADGANPSTYTYGQGVASFVSPTKEHYTFDGWYTSDEVKIESIAVDQFGNFDLTAHWIPVVYEISYDLGAEDAVQDSRNPKSYTYGEGVSQFYEPTRENYDFAGWYLSSIKIDSLSSTQYGNIVIRGKWTPKKYTINYELDGGDQPESGNPTTYEYGVGLSVEELNAPTKEHYDFAGWTRDGEEFKEITTTDTGIVTIKATWTPKTYNIFYNPEGGQLDDRNPSTYVYGESVTISYPPSKEHQVFDGWYLDGTKVDETFVPGGYDITLVAHWNAERFAITYHLDGGTAPAEGNPTEYAFGDGVEKFNEPTKDHYIFLGWFNSAEEKIESLSADSYGAVELFAKWQVESYTIEYDDGMGGTQSFENPTSYTYGQGFDLIEPSRNHYTFDGWFLNDVKIESISDTQFGNIKLVAKWTPDKYNIYYHVEDDVTLDSRNPTEYYYGVGIPYTQLYGASRDGYRFVYWTLENGKEMYSISSTMYGDVDLYPRWRAVSYRVTYDLNGGEMEESTVTTYDHGTGIATLPSPTKENYTFGGWYCDGTLYESISTTQSGDLKLTARWIPQKFSINYDLNNGVLDGENPSEYSYGDTIDISEFLSPEKDYYDFAGWTYLNGTSFSGITEDMSGEINLIANWAAKVYNIYYDYSDCTPPTKTNPSSYTYGIGVGSRSINAPTREYSNFLGWINKETGETVTYITPAMHGDITLKPVWDTIQYNIEYEYNGGGVLSDLPTSYIYGREISADVFTAPSKDNYEFSGWTLEDGTAFTGITKDTTGNIKLVANWTPCVYNIYYEMNGGEMPSGVIYPSQYTYGVGVNLNTISADPTKDYCDFDGWYIGQNKATSVSKTQSGDVTFTAHWSGKRYWITYHDGNDSVSNPLFYYYGIGCTILSPTKDHYDFGGWYSDSTFKTKVTSILPTQHDNIDLYALWTPKTYQITYDMDGGYKDNFNPTSYYYGQNPDELVLYDGLKDYHDFAGWYIGDEPVTKIFEKFQGGDIVVRATWTPKMYMITYDTKDGRFPGGSAVASYIYGVGIDELVVPTKDHYEFGGWMAVRTGEILWSIGKDRHENFTAESGNQLEAVWTAETFDITYDYDGGTPPAISNPTKYAYGEGTGLLTSPTKQNYTFDGWYLTGTNTRVTRILPTETTNISLTAKWTPETYTITYYLNDPDSDTSNPIVMPSPANPESYSYGEGVESFASPSKEHYSFLGWYKRGTETKVESIGTDETTPYYLEAKWEANTRTIKYDYNGGVAPAVENPESYTYFASGKSITFNEPTKEGWTFVGWFMTIDGKETQVKGINAKDDYDMELKAKWSQTVFNITYELNGGQEPEGGLDTLYDTTTGLSSLGTPRKDYYDFKGWKNESGIEFTSIPRGTTGDIKLYAQWTPKVYNITYSGLDGADSIPNNPSQYTYTYGTSKLASPGKAHYVFGGWTLNGQKVESIDANQTGDVELVATWEREVYTVTFVISAASSRSESFEYAYEDAIKEIDEPENSGYTFGGWYTTNNPKDGDEAFDFDGAIATSNLTLYAKWDHVHTLSDWLSDANCHFKMCTEYGCEEFGKRIVEEAHQPVVKNKVDATYKSDGYSGDTYCSVCNYKIASGHTTYAFGTPVYRLYHKKSSEHLYTVDKSEYDYLVKLSKSGVDYWVGEGVAWYAPKDTSQSNTRKIYTLYNAALGAMNKTSHYYTCDTSEIKTLTSKYGWKLESNKTFYSGGDVAIYTAYSEALKSAHLYTADKSEWLSLDSGWDKEKSKNGSNGFFQGVGFDKSMLLNYKG